jgi:penicillin-binding protein 2
MANKRDTDLPFEDSLNDDWSHDLNMVEVPLGNRPMRYLGIAVLVVTLAVLGRVVYLAGFQGTYYSARAEDNVAQAAETPAPRGIIYDREGDALVQNEAAFAAVLDAREFLSDTAAQSTTLSTIQDLLGIAPADLWNMLQQASVQNFATPVVLNENLSQTQLVNLQAINVPAIKIQSDFEREYPNGPIFSAVVGYAGRVTAADLANNPDLTSQDFIGKDGIEEFYDSTLRGIPGVNVQFENAQGQVLRQAQQSSPTIGNSVTLTIDGGLQTAFYNDMENGLQSLGRQVGLGLAIDPQNGQVLSLINLPGYDNNILARPSGNTAEIQSLLTSPLKPLYDRVVSGFYNPGSTIKPLDAVAALKEGVIAPDREIFSPGYLMVPDPYNSSTPTKYLDWRYQGNVNMAAALAQSSDVYFYIVGGGSPAETTPELNSPLDYGISGLGITELHNWWQTFGLGKPTGIDMPDESAGFLPTPEWKEQAKKPPWLLGDTYNVSIGQGDLLLTPVQLLDYIGAIANGGKIYKPFLNASDTPQVSENLTSLLPEIQDVQQGMVEGVTAPLGTAYTLHDLPFSVCAKTGSAQIENNAEENALFVGYAPCNDPQIAILILIENSKQGSLNAVPIAKQVLDWYYENRMIATSTSSTNE